MNAPLYSRTKVVDIYTFFIYVSMHIVWIDNVIMKYQCIINILRQFIQEKFDISLTGRINSEFGEQRFLLAQKIFYVSEREQTAVCVS